MINNRHKCLVFFLKPSGILLLEVFQMVFPFDSANYTRWEGFPDLDCICTSLQLVPVKLGLLNKITQDMITLNEEYFFFYL